MSRFEMGELQEERLNVFDMETGSNLGKLGLFSNNAVHMELLEFLKKHNDSYVSQVRFTLTGGESKPLNRFKK